MIVSKGREQRPLPQVAPLLWPRYCVPCRPRPYFSGVWQGLSRHRAVVAALRHGLSWHTPQSRLRSHNIDCGGSTNCILSSRSITSARVNIGHEVRQHRRLHQGLGLAGACRAHPLGCEVAAPGTRVPAVIPASAFLPKADISWKCSERLQRADFVAEVRCCSRRSVIHRC